MNEDSPMNLLPIALALGIMPVLAEAAELRLGMIGLDTSHVVAFTELLNDPAAKGHVAGAKVVAAFKGGSPDIASSISRVEGYTATLRDKFGVKNARRSSRSVRRRMLCSSRMSTDDRISRRRRS